MLYRRTVLSVLPFVAMARPTLAQVDSPIKVIVPFPAGGGTDLTGRIVSEALAKDLDAPVVVLNKAGAGGSIGMGELVEAAADGHTLAIAKPLDARGHTRSL